MSLPAPVAGCRWPASATMRPATKATTGGGPVHSFATLLENLVTIQLTASSRRAACPPSPSSPRLPHPALSLRTARRLTPGTRSQAPQDHRAFPQADALPGFHAGGTSVVVVAGQ